MQTFADSSAFEATVQALEGLGLAQRARCTSALADAPLPCASGVKPLQCLDGLRPCAAVSDPNDPAEYAAAVAENSADPVLLLDMDHTSWRRGAYIWAVEIDTFPDRTGALLWKSVEDAHLGVGYTLRLLQEHGEPTKVQCMSLNEQAYSEYDIDRTTQQHICAPPLASDTDLYLLAQARYVELVLPGAGRQFFLRQVRVIERALPGNFSVDYPSPAPPLPPGGPEPPLPPPLLPGLK
jgi:hypothetical protein